MPELRDIVIRILSQDGAVCGGGFLAPHGHIATCAHVVNAALKRPIESTDRPEKTDTVRVDLPTLDRGEFTAAVVEWFSPDRAQNLKKDPVEDIAVLKLEGLSDSLVSLEVRTAALNKGDRCVRLSRRVRVRPANRRYREVYPLRSNLTGCDGGGVVFERRH